MRPHIATDAPIRQQNWHARNLMTDYAMITTAQRKEVITALDADLETIAEQHAKIKRLERENARLGRVTPDNPHGYRREFPKPTDLSDYLDAAHGLICNAHRATVDHVTDAEQRLRAIDRILERPTPPPARSEGDTRADDTWHAFADDRAELADQLANTHGPIRIVSNNGPLVPLDQLRDHVDELIAARTPGPRRGPTPTRRPPRTTGDATATPADIANAAGYPFRPDYTEADLEETRP